jgi:hypothetical protein
MLTRIPARHRGIICLISITLLSLFMVILANGCGGPYPATPDQVLVEFSKALFKGDMKKAESFCTTKFKSSPDFAKGKQAMESMSKASNENLSEDQKKKAEELLNSMVGNFESSIEGKTAKVWMKDMKYMTYLLVKEGGRWKIDGYEMNQTEMMNSIQNMMKGGK